MFYSVDILRMLKNRQGRLPKCWFAATTKEFIGASSTFRKLSRKEIDDTDVAAACDDIIEAFTTNDAKARFSLYLSSQLLFGNLRIFQQQVKNLEDDCNKLLGQIVMGVTSSNKKPKPKTDLQIDNEIELPTIDLPGFFNTNLQDVNIMQEEVMFKQVDVLPHFGDEILNFDDDSVRMRPCDTESQTPKRTRQRPHNETPTKRKRITDDISLRTFSPVLRKHLSESATSPVSRKLDMGEDNAHVTGEVASIADNANIPTNEDAAGIVAAADSRVTEAPTIPSILHDNTSVGKSMPAVDVEEPSHENVVPVVEENIFQNQEEINDLQQVANEVPMEIMPVEEVPMEEVPMKEVPPQPVEEVPMEEVPMKQVPPQPVDADLNENIRSQNRDEQTKVIDTPVRNRKRNTRRRIFADTVMQISLKNNIGKTNIYTRSMESDKVNVHARVPAQTLLALPSTDSKIIYNESNLVNKLRRQSKIWGQALRNRFFQMIETPCSNEFEQFDTSEELRYKSIDTNRRISVAGDMLLSDAFSLAINNVDERASERVPITSPSTNRSGGPSKSVTDSSGIRKTVSLPQVEEANAYEAVPNIAIADIPEIEQPPEENYDPVQHGSQFGESSNNQKVLRKEPQKAKSIMTKEEFCKLLENAWVKSGQIIDLDDILPPENTSIIELIIYFNYCCQLELKFKLYLEQEIEYGPVHIVEAEE